MKLNKYFLTIILFYVYGNINILLSQSAFDYLRQAMAKAVLVSALQVGYEYKEGVCLVGAFLSSGSSYRFTMNFDSNNEYKIIGVADEDVQDLDIYIEDFSGNILVQDNLSDNMPIVTYRPSYGANRTIRLKNHSSTVTSFCIFVVLKKRAYSNDLPSFDKISEALSNAVNLSEAYSIFLAGTEFIPGTACLMGGYYSSGYDDGIINYSIPTGRGGKFVYLGAGSNNCSDVDIKIIQQNSVGSTTGTTICSDQTSDKFALVRCDLYSWNTYYLNYKNYRSNGRAFVFSVILKESSSSGGSTHPPRDDRDDDRNNGSRNIFTSIFPHINYTALYFGKKIFDDGGNKPFHEINIYIKTFEKVKLNWGLIIDSYSNDNVGYIGLLVNNFLIKFPYNLNHDIPNIPSWKAGILVDDLSSLWLITIGQMKLLEQELIFYNYRFIINNKFTKVFFADIKCEVELLKPLWLNFNLRYPFSKGEEFYQLGAGVSLRI